MLPKISQPTFDLVIPSTGATVRYRPFTVREEKILLVAQASGEQSDYVNAFKQIVQNCIIEPVDVDSLASYDIEYIFVKLRARSVSNKVELTITDDYDVEVKAVIDLDEIQVHKSTVNRSILLDEERDIGVRMKYPTFGEIDQLSRRVNGDVGMQGAMELLISLIDCIWEGEAVYPASTSTLEELREFVQDFSAAQVAKMEEFLSDLPYVYIDINYKDSTGAAMTRRVSGISSFFG